jgi:Bax protein
MPLHIKLKPLWLQLAWLPVVFHPLQAGAADTTSPAQQDSSETATASQLIFLVPREEALEIPDALDSSAIAREEKKRLFLETVLPLVLLENERLTAQRARVRALLTRKQQGNDLAEPEWQWLRQLADEYHISGNPLVDATARDELLSRVDIIPVELALAQAAMETGWGGSRSARREHDLFGMTAFVPRQGGRSSRKGKGKNKRPPKFVSVRESVRVYMLTLNSHASYAHLRAIRAKFRADKKPLRGLHVAEGLRKYSTRGTAYVKMVQNMIRSNDLDRYAMAKLEPVARDQVALLRDPGDS